MKQTNAPSRLIGDPLVNCQDEKVEKTLLRKDKVMVENSLGIDIGLETEAGLVFERVKVQVEKRYEHKWGEEHTFSQGVTFHVKTKCSHTPPPGSNGLVSAPPSWVTIHHVGSSSHNRIVGGPESNTTLGLGGNDVILGGGGNDRLSGGAGNDRLSGGTGNDLLNGGTGLDVLKGGPGRDILRGGFGNDTLIGGTGRDTLDGGPGADRLIDTSGPTLVRTGRNGGATDYVDVRDGGGDDTVVCGTPRTLVVADPGDRARGHCGRVVRTGPVSRISR